MGASSSASLSSTKSPAGLRWVGSRTGTSRAARRGWLARAGRSTTKVVRLALTGPAAPVASTTTVRGRTTPARWSASPGGSGDPPALQALGGAGGDRGHRRPELVQRLGAGGRAGGGQQAGQLRAGVHRLAKARP